MWLNKPDTKLQNASASPFFKSVPWNEKGRDFVVGDLHGMLTAFQEQLEAVSFNPLLDRVFSVGDLIDRGPESYKVLSLINEPWFHAVRGNHEQMMLDATSTPKFETWLLNGGDWILKEPGEHWVMAYQLAWSLPFAIEISGGPEGPIGITHTDIPDDDWTSLENNLEQKTCQHMVLWSRRRLKEKRDAPVKGAHITIHGHTPVDQVTRRSNSYYIDTGCVYGGSLTLINLDAL